MKIEVAVIVSVVSAIIAAVSAGIAYRNYRREQLNQKIAAAKWQREYFVDLLKWSDECLLQLSEALHLCDLDPQRCEKRKFFDARHTLRIRLSAQIDRGRWFFPNYAAEEHGQHKEGAFRGYRPAVLDALVYAYRSVTSLNYVDGSQNGPRRKELETAKRQFTSEIQAVLDPRQRDEEFRRLIGRVQGV